MSSLTDPSSQLTSRLFTGAAGFVWSMPDDAIHRAWQSKRSSRSRRKGGVDDPLGPTPPRNLILTDYHRAGEFLPDLAVQTLRRRNWLDMRRYAESGP